MSATYSVGSLVRARGRDWVVLPPSSDDADVLLLKPLGGTDLDIAGIYLPLEGDSVRHATFDRPLVETARDNTAAALLRDAVRLTLRNGAGPFRSFGKVAVEPRTYQIVPLLMALKLNPIRLLIADDVGVGKTIEAGLIAREMLDRGEIDRIAVLCPPHLCDQWQAELSEKFHIEAEVVRPGTISKLERDLQPTESIFGVYPHLVISIDYIKSDRRRDDFINECPEFVIVDEAHTCSAGASQSSSQQRRHALLRDLMKSGERHLVLATATPHSGIETAFRSLLELLDPAFADLPVEGRIEASHPLRQKLAQHFVQRRRADVRNYDISDEAVFPDRESKEATYLLSQAYQTAFDDVFRYTRELVQDTEGLTANKQRIRWWAALAMLRCIVSSPAAGAMTLRNRAAGLAGEDGAELTVEDLNALGNQVIFDQDASDVTESDDLVPGADTIEDESPNAAERRRLRTMAEKIEALGGEQDRKLQETIRIVRELIRDGFHPIVFCRFLATADYVAEALRKELRNVEVVSVTGTLPPEERAARVAELGTHESRVLVATDCLSEGINLQDHFTAVLHYDLAWNPTRHEQREGRVDRYGQKAKTVRTVLLYGENNRIDGAVMRVLIRKAEQIRQSLGISVPVPASNEKVLEALFESLFLSSAPPEQLAFQFDQMIKTREDESDERWQAAAEREQQSRTIFAQNAIRASDIKPELDEARRALGDHRDVQRFVTRSVERLGSPLGHVAEGVFRFNPGPLPPAVTEQLPANTAANISFTFPAPEGARHVGRTSDVVEALSSHLVGTALAGDPDAVASRCGAIRTADVTTRTTLLLLRVRMHLDVAKGGETISLLAEESIVAAYEGSADEPSWLDRDQAEALLNAQPAADLTPELRQEQIESGLAELDLLADDLDRLADERAAEVLESHRRVRSVMGQAMGRQTVRAVKPVDVLGVYVLVPRPVM